LKSQTLRELILGALVWAPRLTVATVDVVLAIIFIAWLGLRIFGTLVTGYLTSIILGLVGLAHRGLLASGFVLLHWLMLSLAAWRALWQLVPDPYRWEKTEHGLARTSRRAKIRSRR
jgi:hypothetical protein